MQIEAGRKQAGPRVRGVWLRETPRPQVPSVTFAMGAERQKGRSERSLPAEPLPRFRLPSGCRTTSGLFSAGGLGGETGLKPAPSGLCQAPPPHHPALRSPHTGGFPLRRGRPRHFYVTIELCAPRLRLPVAEAPAWPRLHPAGP